jgi:hypothetical protein
VTVLAAVLAAGAVQAAHRKKPAAAPQPAAPVMVRMQARPQQVGDRYSFTAVTDQQSTQAGKTTGHGDTQAFNLEILGITPTGMVVAYTQTSGEITPGASDAWRASLRAWNGVRVVYETDLAGRPMHIRNLPEAEAAYLDAFGKQPGVTDAMVQQVKAGFAKATDTQLAQRDIGNQLNALSAMQVRQPLPAGAHDLRPDEGVRKDGSKLEVRHSIDLRDMDTSACQATLQRVTWTDNAAMTDELHSKLDATARVSTADGWVVDMTEVDTLSKGDATSVKTVKFHRDAGPVVCAQH